MILKFKKLYLFSLLFLLQSCSGGRLGNFLESSFKNNDKSKITYSGNNKEENNLGIDAVNKNLVNQNLKKNIKNKETDLLSEKKMDINNNEANLLSEKKTNIQNKDGITSDRKITFNKNREQINIKKRGKSKQQQSYRITVILNEVDPSSPSEDFSNVLRNANLNFEIEKIERLRKFKNSPIKKDFKNK